MGACNTPCTQTPYSIVNPQQTGSRCRCTLPDRTSSLCAPPVNRIPTVTRAAAKVHPPCISAVAILWMQSVTTVSFDMTASCVGLVPRYGMETSAVLIETLPNVTMIQCLRFPRIQSLCTCHEARPTFRPSIMGACKLRGRCCSLGGPHPASTEASPYTPRARWLTLPFGSGEREKNK